MPCIGAGLQGYRTERAMPSPREQEGRGRARVRVRARWCERTPPCRGLVAGGRGAAQSEDRVAVGVVGSVAPPGRGLYNQKIIINIININIINLIIIIIIILIIFCNYIFL